MIASFSDSESLPRRFTLLFLLLAVAILCAGQLPPASPAVIHWYFLTFDALLALATGISIGLFWGYKRNGARRKRYELELERKALEEHYGVLMKYSNDMEVIAIPFVYNGNLVCRSLRVT